MSTDTYKIIEVNDDGSGYVVFYWVDGTSCGQMIKDMPVHDATMFNAALFDRMTDVYSRHTAPTVPLSTDVSLKAAVGMEQPIDALRSAALAVDVLPMKLV